MNVIAKRSNTFLTYHSFYSHLCRSYSKAVSLKKIWKFHSPYNCMLFASAAAISLSAYVTLTKSISCESNECKDELNESKETKSRYLLRQDKYKEAIRKSRDLLLRLKDEVGAPGIVIGVSIDGDTVWTEGLGYADIENRVLCSPETVMRIASISKSITMTAVAKLWEQGKLDLDKPIQEYVPSFPQKTFDGKPVVITCRQLLSHMGGIRHYSKNNASNNDSKNCEKNRKEERGEFDNLEYYIKEKHDVKSSLNLFKDDPLVKKPGTKFHYTTHGWTLISAIVEAVSKEEFPRHLNKLFKALGMRNTYFDENDIIIYHRSRNYKKNKNGHLINTPYVDNSYKWAGGGILSTVSDLLQFGNAMLYSYQFKDTPLEKENVSADHIKKDKNNIIVNQKSKLLPGYLKSKTVETIWTSVVSVDENSKYAMGWATFPEKHECQYCEKVKFCIYHTGGAIGASSILLIMPKSLDSDITSGKNIPPKGVIIAILTNLMPVNLTNTALKIAEFFN